ncbi:MAG: DUF4382 domain-containing protein [Calditrichaeota bacterium]|nr:DUF4382 domain-containing protein [Calditrichota bacterium]RQW05371.1 MAG: DUF4382 domain-containing protein [Calditrichota bacterium]
MTRKSIFVNSVFWVFFLLFLIGCDKDINNVDTGTLRIKLTDAPFPIDMVSEANVTINKIEIRQESSQAGENPFLVLTEEELGYNLLDLQNGITADLAEIEIPVGDYNLLRLYVSAANIILTDGTVYDLTIPSGAQTGIKIFVEPAIQVVGGLTTELVLDFDVSQSFIVQGNPFTPAGINGFIFTPVIRAANISTTGSISGKVIDNLAIAIVDAIIWIEDDANTYSSFSNNEGLYTLSFIPAGTYTVYATKKTATVEYDTVSVENVEVVAGNVTALDDIVLTQQ